MFKDDLCGSDDPLTGGCSMKLFNSAYKSELTNNTPPESIKNLVNFNLGEPPKKIGSQATTKTARRQPEPWELIENLDFDERPRIANRSDALYLLDRMIDAVQMQGTNYALEALKDALEQEII
jgi:hypothetical protein